MPRYQQETPTRRLLMQASMWIVLGATVSLAAWYTHARKSSFHVDLDEPQDVGFMTIQLPAKWTVSRDGGPVVLKATEGRQNGGRTLSIIRERTGTLMSPREYLARTNIYELVDSEELRMDVKEGPIDFAGWPGFFFVGVRAPAGIPTMEGMILRPQVGLFACTVLPSHQAITISIEGPVNRLDESDVELLSAIIRSINLKDEPALVAQEKVSIGNVATFDAPAGFSLIPNTDPNRQSVRLLNSAPNSWATIELVPCILPSTDTGSILALLSLHDAQWVRGRVRQVKQDEWRADANAAREFNRYAVRAYVKTTDEGQAVLAIARSQSPDVASLDSAWDSIIRTLQVKSPGNLPAMFNAGAEAVTKFRASGLQQLVGDRRGQQWWLWASDHPEHFLGWSHLQFDDSAPWSLTSQSKWREAERRIAGSVQRWKSTEDLRSFNYEMIRSDATASLDDALKPTRAQASLLTPPGRLGTKLSVSNTVVYSESVQAPRNFISGAWLQWLLGKAGGDPMILATETVPGFEGAFIARPILLMIEPSPDHPRNDDAGRPMRCLAIGVNGTGHIQRWYFAADGSLQYMSLPGSQHREPTTREQIKFNLNEDSRLVP